MFGVRRRALGIRPLRANRPVSVYSYTTSSPHHSHVAVRRSTNIFRPPSQRFLRSSSSTRSGCTGQRYASTERATGVHAVVPKRHRGSTGFTVLASADTDITAKSLAPEITRMSEGSDAGTLFLVLATPQFHRLLTANDELIEALVSEMSKRADNVAEVDVILGVVSRIPWPRPSLAEQRQDGVLREAPVDDIVGAEGVAITSLLRLTKPGDADGDESANAEGHIYIQTATEADGQQSPSRGPQLGLELADTNLLTGQNHFLRHQIWSKASASRLEKTSDTSIRNCHLQLPALDADSFRNALSISPGKSMYVSPPRTISSAFGNVIKSFHGSDLTTTDPSDNTAMISASADLERFAHDIKAEKYFTSLPEIWAIVEPAGTPSSSLAASTDDLRVALDRGGVRIFRVNGGGGGWEGSAGGNISLEVDEDDTFSPFPDLDAAAADGDDDMSLPDFFSSTIKSGDIVTFVAVGPRKGSADGDHRTEQHARSEPDSSAVHSSFKFLAGRADGEHGQPPPLSGRLVFHDYFGALSHRIAYVAAEDGNERTVAKRRNTATRLPSYSGLDYVRFLPGQTNES